jgi:O-antigen/teichoic acid export membrane protein
MKLAHELKRLGRHTAVYGLGGMVSRVLAVILLPLYTHYLPTSAYGKVETITALTAVLSILLQLGIGSAFFRFYFDAPEASHKLTVVRTSFWFTMGMATLGLAIGTIFAPQIARLLGLGSNSANLVIAGSVGLWAQTNYQQLTALFRVEERSTAYAIASVTNVFVTIMATILFVAVWQKGAIGLIIGNFTGTLLVYFALVIYRFEQLGLQFDRTLYRSMQKFGMPLVPAALALWVINFIDRQFIIWYKGPSEVGVYSVAIKVASIITFVMVAFRTAWPAFAYSIDDDREARRTYSFVLTYLLAIASWAALGLGALAPWWVAALTNPRYQRAQEAVALLAFAFAIYAGYTVMAIGSGRARKTQLNWVVAGTGAAINIGLNFWLIPKWGMVGAAISTLVSYVALFVGMTIYAQSVYRVAYQWRRVCTVLLVGAGLTLAARVPHLPFVPSLLLVIVYPLVLLALGFYLPAERARLRRLVPILR